MIIGFDAKRLYNNFTGLGNYSRTLLKNLSLFFPDNDYYLYTPKIKISEETQEFFNNPVFKTVLPANHKLFWRSFSILKNLKIDNIQLYHGLSHEIPFKISDTFIKSIVTIHDLIFKKYPETYSAIDKIIYDFKFKYSCTHANKIIAISNSTKMDIVDYYGINPNKIEVIYQSCNHIFFQLKNEKEVSSILNKYNIPSDYLLYVGSIIPRKNLITIIKSYKYLPKDLRIPIVVIGKGKEYKKKTQQYAKKARIDNLIIWIDNLSDDNHLQAFYQNAKVFIYPSLIEGFGLPVVEALLSKVPVITSNISSLPEAGGPNSYYIDPVNAEEMAVAIEKIYTDADYSKKMIEKGYIYAKENFNSLKTSKKVIDLYEKILHQ